MMFRHIDVCFGSIPLCFGSIPQNKKRWISLFYTYHLMIQKVCIVTVFVLGSSHTCIHVSQLYLLTVHVPANLYYPVYAVIDWL